MRYLYAFFPTSAFRLPNSIFSALNAHHDFCWTERSDTTSLGILGTFEILVICGILFGLEKGDQAN
jgi:hypothetical protein